MLLVFNCELLPPFLPMLLLSSYVLINFFTVCLYFCALLYDFHNKINKYPLFTLSILFLADFSLFALSNECIEQYKIWQKNTAIICEL